MLTRQQSKKANAEPSDRFSDREFSALLEDDSDGDRLAEFLLKRKGIDKRPKRVYAEYKPTRYSIEVHTEPIKTPKVEKTVPAQLQDEVIDLISPEREKSDSAVAIETVPQVNDLTAVPAATAALTAAPGLPTLPASPPAPVRSSPSQRISLHRSGGMPNADRLRRFTLKRLSKLPSNNSSGGRRTLLQEFESTISDSNFIPPICSTPMTQLLTEGIPNQTPAPMPVLPEKCNTEVQNAHKTIVAEAVTTPMPSPSPHNQTTNEHLLSTLIKHNQELNDLLDKDRETSLVEKENLYRTLTTTPPPVNRHGPPNTPSSDQRRRTYTIKKGSVPGQVVLTPAKKQPAQQQEQPSSTVGGGGMLERPTSPVEEAVYALHSLNNVSSSNMPTKPIVASPKVMKLLHHVFGKSPHKATKEISAKKSRIPLFRSNEKLQVLTPLNQVESTPEKVCNPDVDDTSLLEIPETQEQIEGHVEIPETQCLHKETQELLNSIQKAQSPSAPMIVIPIHQTFNHTPHDHETIIAGKKLTPRKECAESSQTHFEADTTMNQPLTTQNKTKDMLRNNSRCNKSPSPTPPEPQIFLNEDELRLSDIITEDEDELPAPSASRRITKNDTTDEVSKMQNSNAPLNLAAAHEPSEKRTRRLRKRSANRRAHQKKVSPPLTTETECEMGPPRAHPSTIRRTHIIRDSRRKMPLNAAPNTPINGERFAVEMKTHLARLKNHEILDLRKRNSLGKVFPISGRKSLLSKHELAKKLQLEEDIEMEILRRNLEGKIPADDPLLREVDQEEVESYFDTQQDELMLDIPPAPADFRDDTNGHLNSAKSLILHSGRRESSLVDDRSCDQVKFVQDVPDISSIKSNRSKRSRRRKKDMPEVMQKYLDVHQRWSQTPKLRSSKSKRHLFSQDNSPKTADQTLPETETAATVSFTQQPAVAAQRVAETMPSTSTYLSSNIIDNPLPPPDSFADEDTHVTGINSMAVSTVAGTSIANDTADNNVFKKPHLPAPIVKTKKKHSVKASPKPSTSSHQKTMKKHVNVAKTPQRMSNNVEDDVTAEAHDDSESLRRSKRGHKPLRNYWSFRSTDPTPLYDIVILERRREEAKRLREAKLSSSKVANNTTVPSASSTMNENKGITATKRGRPKKKVERTESDSSSTSSIETISKPRRKNRLTTISESDDVSPEPKDTERPLEIELENELGPNMGDNIENKGITATKRGRPKKKVERTESDSSSTSPIVTISKPRRKKRLTTISESDDVSPEPKDTERPLEIELENELEPNMGDNMFAQLDEVDISSACSSKILRTRQKIIPEKKAKAAEKKAKAEEKKAKAEEKKAKADEKKAKEKTTKKATEKAIKNAREEANKRTTEELCENVAKEASKENANDASKKSEKRANQKKKSDKSADAEHREDSWKQPSFSTSISIQPSTAAHINDLFDKLRGASLDVTPVRPIAVKPTMSTLPTALKNARVRLPRLRQIDSSCTTSASTASTIVTPNNNLSQFSSSSCDNHSNAPGWLRDISYVGSKIFKDSDKEKGNFFNQMHGSNPDNLALTDLDGVDYLYYENDKDIPFGYMRFQPKQFKKAKTAKLFHLSFFVLSGKVKIKTNQDEAVFSEGAVVTIYKGSRYTVENISNKLSILMVFRRS